MFLLFGTPEKLAYAVMGTTKSEKKNPNPRYIYTQADALVFVFVVLFVFLRDTQRFPHTLDLH